jgi:membrane-bound lytic murein transglycosylase B
MAAFRDWLAGFRARAAEAGITEATLTAALDGMEPLPEVVARDRNQTEVTRTLREYLAIAASDARIAGGRAVLAARGDLLARIEAAYGVDRHVLVAIWGLESSFGANRGDIPVIAALATLAHDGRRAALFEGQLIAALRILQAGDVDRAALVGSWAGAMGHMQFMPTSYLDRAVDFDGDERRDIWGDDPTDALASAAAYLAAAGWVQGQPWGVEVCLPPAFDAAWTGRETVRTGPEWLAEGVRALADGALADHGPASVLLPAGVGGPALLVFGNFGVLRSYNAADAYVVGVGHLADRIAGGGPLQGVWPEGDRALAAAERSELQHRLVAAGFDAGAADGVFGPQTRTALRAFQRAAGLPPDGYPGPDVLARLRQG